MIIDLYKIRAQHKRAKTAFREKSNWSNWSNAGKRYFFTEYAKEYNLKLVIPEWITHFGTEYPRIVALEFNNEQDAAWFVLRWS
jgi:hypothetical protein